MPFLELIYLLTTGLLAIYGWQALFLTLKAGRRRRHLDAAPRRGSPADPWRASPHPRVTVQLPVFNERHVVARLLDAVAAFDWPRERLQIQVLDDSTDDTTQIIARLVDQLRQQGLDIEHRTRARRTGFKAGALESGMASATGEFIAIFDADFVPPVDFLRRTMPVFDEPAVGCVQARWGHLNAGTSSLTLAQSLGIDGHFTIEQFARDRIGAYLNFNGTAGIWRRSAMAEAGGWQGDTLTEDLDLSYRAQMAGWRIRFHPEVVVPAELPVQLDAYKRQQFRWAKGSIQTAIKTLAPLWRSRQPLGRRLLGAVHLTSYLVHPLMVANLLFLPPIMSSTSLVLKVASLCALSAIGPPLMYWRAMALAGVSRRGRVGRLLLLLAMGAGLTVNNSRGVLEALLGVDSAFKRTPKFAVTDRTERWHTSSYVLPSDPTVWGEALLGLYAGGLLITSLLTGIWWLLPWLLLYVCGYGYTVHLALRQAWQKREAARAFFAAASRIES